MTLIDLPCTARELENALHAACDHHGAWDAEIHYGIGGQDLDAVPTLRIVIGGEQVKQIGNPVSDDPAAA